MSTAMPVIGQVAAGGPVETLATPLQQYHARLSQHLNALLSSGGSSGSRVIPPPSTATSSLRDTSNEASSSRTSIHASHASSPKSRRHPPTTSTRTRQPTAPSRSHHSSHSSSSPSRRSSLDVIPDPSDPELTAKPDKHPPVLTASHIYHELEFGGAPPPLVHHHSSSQSGTTEAIASPNDPLSPPPLTSPVDQRSRDTPDEPSGPVEEGDHVESREEEHRRAWKSDGARVWKAIPKGFTLSLDRRSRRSSAESKEGRDKDVVRTETVNNASGSASGPRPRLPQSNLSQGSSPSISPGQKSFISSPSFTHAGAHSPELRIHNEPDLAAKMGLVVSSPALPAVMSPPTYTFGKSVSHVQPVPPTKPDVLADINGRLKLSDSKHVPRSPLGNPSLGPAKPSGPTVVTLGPMFSIPREKTGPRSKPITPELTPKERAINSTAVVQKSSKQQKLENLRNAFDDPEGVDTEYEARRQLRLKKREMDLKNKIGSWASGVNVVDPVVPEIDPTPPSPSVATAAMLASPLVPIPQTPVHERSKLSLSLISDSQSNATSSTRSSGRKHVKSKKSRESLVKESSETHRPTSREPFVVGHAPRPSLKGSMFTYSTSINDSSRRMRAIDALLGDMSLRGTNLNPSSSINTFSPGGTTTHSGAFGANDGDTTPRRVSQSKEAPSSLNPQSHSRLSSLERRTEGGRLERAKEISKLTEFSESFDLTTGAGLGNGSALKRSTWEVNCGMPTPKPKGVGVMSYTEL